MARPKRIILLRHGESMGNLTRETHATVPDWRIELSVKGHLQSLVAGNSLRDALGPNAPLGVYLSPYRRTKQTWDGVASRLGLTVPAPRWVKEDPRLREQEWGGLRAYDPRTWEDIEQERDDYGTFFYRFAHGESGADVYDRCTGFLETAYRDFEKPDMPDNVLIVTHGYTLRVLLMRWLHWTVDQFHELSNPRNCAWFELRLNAEERYELVTPFPRKGEQTYRSIPHRSSTKGTQ